MVRIMYEISCDPDKVTLQCAIRTKTHPDPLYIPFTWNTSCRLPPIQEIKHPISWSLTTLVQLWMKYITGVMLKTSTKYS